MFSRESLKGCHFNNVNDITRFFQAENIYETQGAPFG